MNGDNVALESEPFLVVSDIHADAERIKKTLRTDIGAAYRCSLGDVVGYGEQASETLAAISGFDVGILGNHDEVAREAYATAPPAGVMRKAWDQGRSLDTAAQEVLSRFVPIYRRSGIALFHGTPSSNQKYLFGRKAIESLFTSYPADDLLLGGHLHVPRVVARSRATGDLLPEPISAPLSRHLLDLSKNQYYVSFPSLSQPRGGHPGGYGVIYPGPASDQKLLVLRFG